MEQEKKSVTVLGFRFWALKCKVCRNYHKGTPVDENSLISGVLLCGKYECPDRPGEMGYSSREDWVPMTAAEWDALTNK
jgi:hypothetical protein